jgi:hypothetical protein
MPEIEIDGSDVLGWLRRVPLQQAQATLIGCGLDNHVDEEALEIKSIDESLTLQCVYKSIQKAISPTYLNNCLVIDRRPGFPLLLAIESTRTPAERELRQAENKISSYGIATDGYPRGEYTRLVCDALISYEKCYLPPENIRFKMYEAFDRFSMPKISGKIVRKWINISLQMHNYIYGDMIIKLATYRRRRGEIKKALNAVQVTEKYNQIVIFSQKQIGIFARIRASIYLDACELECDPKWLVNARRCAGVAWAVGPKEATRQVYNRLARLESSF